MAFEELNRQRIVSRQNFIATFSCDRFYHVSIGSAPAAGMTEHRVVMVLFHGLVGRRTKLQYPEVAAASPAPGRPADPADRLVPPANASVISPFKYGENNSSRKA
ncbi:MAG: hypothetical protein QF541_14990 [Lentisphaeria bacterium]|nr:hypothetical protein [Lentisphaeria bacterium]